MTRRILAGLVALVVAQTGCEGEAPPSGCKEGHTVGDVCAGVPNDPICEEEYCTQGVTCAAVHQAANAAELDQALGRAAAGDCIALASGAYGLALLPAGVSLLGPGADRVRVDAIETGGAGVRLRGITVDSGSVVVRDGDTVVEALRIQNSQGDGVTVGATASVTVRASEIRSASRYGVSAIDSGSVTLERTIIDGRGVSGPGMWAQCASGCDCTASTSVSMTDVKITGNTIVGLSLVGASAHLDNVEVTNTDVGQSFDAGGGISASACSTLTATDLRIADNEDFGLLLDDSGLDVDGFSVARNLRGVWMQNIGASMPATASLRNATVTENRGVGIGVASSSVGVTIQQTVVSDTKVISLPVLIDGVSASTEQVGDGITWKGGSQVALDGVTVSASQRVSVLIDGEVGSGSSIANVTLAGGDESLGILQQSVPEGGEQPSVTGSPSVTVLPDEQYSVPADVAIPPTI